MTDILKPEVQQFIREHINDDPVKLLLKHKEVAGVPLKKIIEQITALKKSRNKLPEWSQNEQIIFPASISMEQCSSQTTAEYKASLCKGQKLVDLTGGAGVDTYYMAKNFVSADYIERNSDLVDITRHNHLALGASNITHHNADSVLYLRETSPADVIYIDPARRDSHANKVFKIEDCEPNVIELMPSLISKSAKVIIKTSPMLDIQSSLRSLQQVGEVHVVSVDNECKEVLYILEKGKDQTRVITVNFRKNYPDQIFSFTVGDEASASASLGHAQGFLFEPNSSILKAGAFQLITSHFNVQKLHANTHLYTSDSDITDFPGRRFKILDTVPYSKKAVQPYLDKKKANLSLRNFPDDVKSIKKKLDIKDGGEIYLFAHTNIENKKVIAITHQIW